MLNAENAEPLITIFAQALLLLAVCCNVYFFHGLILGIHR